MRVYRVQFHDEEDGSSIGFRFFTRKREAEKAARKGSDDPVKIVDIELSRRGVLKALDRLASHPDNG